MKRRFFDRPMRLLRLKPRERGTATPTPVEEICPVAVPDLSIWTLYKRGPSGRPVYIMGSPHVDRFVLIPPEAIAFVHDIPQLFDGNHSISEITNLIEQRYARTVDVARLYQSLSRNGLILTPRPKYVQLGDIESMSLKVFEADIQSAFARMAGFAKATVPSLALLSGLLILAGLYVRFLDPGFTNQAARIRLHASLSTDIVLYYSLLVCSFLFHEVSHGLAATYFGLIPRRVCFSFYFGYLPMIYLRIGGIYTLSERRRMMVWGAGVWWNAAFASVCVLTLRFASLPAGTAHIVSIAATANYWMAIVNLLPLLPTDGYFILVTLLKGVNIRSRAWRDLATLVKRRSSQFTPLTLSFLVVTLSASVLILIRSLHSIHSSSDVRLWLAVVPIGALIVRSLIRRHQRQMLTAAAPKEGK